MSVSIFEPDMKLTARIERLPLHDTFTISRGSTSVSETVIVEVAKDGVVGRGEALPISYYGQSPAETQKSIEALVPWLSEQDFWAFRPLLEEVAARSQSHSGVVCALDLALHDWVGKQLGVPLYKLLGLRPDRLPETSFTIGLDSIETMVAKLRRVDSMPIIKVKLGTDKDLEIIAAIRKETSATLRVDANCGWTPRETIEKSHALAALGVEFIEQPLPADALEEMEEVYAHSALPLIADENSVRPEDVPRLQGRFHGINIKLVKCGGILPALRMIELARAFDLKTMLGCMVESSLGVTAAAHLGPLVDYLDLDGPLLIARDPFRGVEYDGAKLRLPSGPGLGVEPR